MRALLEHSSRGAKLKYLLKIAWKTIPRCGINGLLFLLLGFCLLFSACEALQDLRTLQNEPIEAAAVILTDSVAMEELSRIEGVRAISPVCRVDAEVIAGEDTLGAEIIAVLPEYLDPTLVRGGMFPGSSNMPYLVINQASAAILGDLPLSAAPVSIRISGGTYKAMVCGIIDDKKPQPCVYMSYHTGRILAPGNGDRELLVTLAGIKALESANETLQRLGVLLEYEHSESSQIALLELRIRYSLALSGSLLLCAAALLHAGHRRECIVCSEEITVLRSSGIPVGAIFPLRLFLAVTAAMLCALAIVISG